MFVKSEAELELLILMQSGDAANIITYISIKHLPSPNMKQKRKSENANFCFRNWFIIHCFMGKRHGRDVNGFHPILPNHHTYTTKKLGPVWAFLYDLGNNFARPLNSAKPQPSLRALNISDTNNTTFAASYKPDKSKIFVWVLWFRWCFNCHLAILINSIDILIYPACIACNVNHPLIKNLNLKW